jgi:tetratricopeptide (TPR) repeat protein
VVEGELERARRLLDQGRYDEALGAVGPVLARSPHDPEARLVAGWAARGLDQPEQAWEHASVAAQGAPDDGEALALMSLSDLDTRLSIRCDRARELGRRAVDADPWNPVAHVALVHALLDDPACVDEARDAADAAVRRFPQNALLLTLAAQTRMSSGRGTIEDWEQAQARSLLEEALRIEPAHRQARHLLGVLDDAKGRGTSSLRGLAAQLAEDPGDATTQAMLRGWLVGTALIWSVGLGVVTLAELWSLLSDLAGSHAFAAGLGGVALAAAAVRAASADLASRGAARVAALADARIRWATLGPLAASVLLALAPWSGTLAVPLVLGAGVLLVVGAVNGARA